MTAAPAVAARASAPVPAYRAGLTILFLTVLLNLFDRQVINVLAVGIKAELHLSDTMIGLLTGTACGLFYAAMGLPAGRLADRLDRGRLIAAMVAIWSMSTLVCGMAASYAVLVLGRIGVGIGEGGAQPACTALAADLAPPDRRSSALSLMLLGVPLGMLLSYMVGGLAAQAWGWRAAFFVAGVPGIVVALLIYAFVRDPKAGGAPAARFEGSTLAALAEVMRKPRMSWLVVGLSTAAFDAYVTNAWIPSFFVRVHALSLAEIGVYGALGVGIGGAIGTAGAGPLCDWLRRRTPYPESWALIASTSLGIPWLLLMTFAPDTRVALAAMAMFQVTAFAWLAPITRLIQDAAGPAHRALATAYCGAFASIFTSCIGIPGVGLVSDLLAPATGAWSVGYALCLLAVPVALTGVAAHSCVLR